MGVLYGLQHVFEFRTRLVPGSDQFATGYERCGPNFFFGKRFVAVTDEVVDVEIAVRGHAVHAMQSEVFGELVEAEEPLEGRRFHARCIGEAHVIVDEREDLAGLVVRETEAAADICCDCDADFYMAIEADAIRSFAESGRLADIVEESPPGQRHGAAGLELLEEHKRVDPDVALGMELGRLLNTFHP